MKPEDLRIREFDGDRVIGKYIDASKVADAIEAAMDAVDANQAGQHIGGAAQEYTHKQMNQWRAKIKELRNNIRL